MSPSQKFQVRFANVFVNNRQTEWKEAETGYELDILRLKEEGDAAIREKNVSGVGELSMSVLAVLFVRLSSPHGAWGTWPPCPYFFVVLQATYSRDCLGRHC